MKDRTLKRSENPPVDSYTIDEDSFNHYWKFFQPPGNDEEFTLINQTSIEKDELLFIYGTLRDPKIQTKTIGRLIKGTPDTLLGYGKSTVTFRGIVYPILIPEADGVIEGEILKLSKAELVKVDEYETNAYRRVKVKLKSGIKTWVYMK